MSHATSPNPLDLLVYTRSFAVMLGAGVSLRRALDILEDISDEPLKSATAEMRTGICERDRILSGEMRERPNLFTPMYVAMVRAGEVGGVLDESLLRVADGLEADWRDAQAVGAEFRSLLFPSPRESGFADRPSYQRFRILSEYFGALALMLTAGVPLGLALETAAEVLPPGPERDALAGVAPQVVRDRQAPSDALRLPFLPDFTWRLLKIGEETRTFDTMCDKIAQLLECQERYQRLKGRG